MVVTDEAFLAFVQANAPRFELETLEKAAKILRESVASRRWGKPVGLEVGSRVAAEAFDGFWHHYGTVKRFTEKGCILEIIESEREQRVPYAKYAVRIIDDYEWNRAAMVAEERHKEVEAEIAEDAAKIARERDLAIANRAVASKDPITIEAINGKKSLFVGAYIHAHRPGWQSHEYGVVIDLSSNACVIARADLWDSRVTFTKHEIDVFDDEEWKIVSAELARRTAAVEAAKKAGNKQRATKLEVEFERTPVTLAP